MPYQFSQEKNWAFKIWNKLLSITFYNNNNSKMEFNFYNSKNLINKSHVPNFDRESDNSTKLI